MNQTALPDTLNDTEQAHEDDCHWSFLHDVLEGLQQTPKTLPCKYFYDDRGSRLFEDICLLDEYYITRVELKILQQYANEIAALIGDNAVVIEPGSGAGEKIQLLLSALSQVKAYIPIEISREILQRSSDVIQKKYPELLVYPVQSDFSTSLDNFTQAVSNTIGDNRCLFFPGSTIGNFSPDQAIDLLKKFVGIIGPSGCILIGVDRLKNRDILRAAYNDSRGVTAAFNKNILQRANYELGANFTVDQFSHKATFNEHDSRIEMHLSSNIKQTVTIAGKDIVFNESETIHTENSYKYSDDLFQSLLRQSGLQVKKQWLDKEQLFSLYLLSPA